jgi:biopolymer transport protein ExbD
MIKSIANHVVPVLAVLVLAGCATNSSKMAGATVHISLLSNGLISVDGNQIEINKTGKKLKALGCKPSTAIVVAVPSNVSQVSMNNISSALRSEGFPRVIFATPKKTQSSTAQPTTTATPSSPTKSSKTQKPVRSGTL